MTTLQTAKNILKSTANDAKSIYRNDKPAVRMIINDTADSISRDMQLTEKQRNSLANYACTLHPKN